MSILDYNLDNVPDEQTVEGGEYNVKILSAQPKDSKAGKPMIALVLGFTDVPDSKSCFHYLSLPSDGDEQTAINGKLRRLKNFYEAFGVDYSGPVEMDNLVGETAFAIVDEEENEEFGARNNIKRFLAQK